MHLIARENEKVAVLAIDPTSSQSRGSVLGDKTRMTQLARHVNAFIRPSPNALQQGGVAGRTREAVLVCEAAGYSIICIETVGVGQNEIAIKDMVDLCLVLVLAGAGDGIQTLKRGILEIADAIVLHKTGSLSKIQKQNTLGMYTQGLALFMPSYINAKHTPMYACDSVTKTGIAKTWQGIKQQYKQALRKGLIADKRRMQKQAWLVACIHHIFDCALASPSLKKQWQTAQQSIQQEKWHPQQAAAWLFDQIKTTNI